MEFRLPRRKGKIVNIFRRLSFYPDVIDWGITPGYNCQIMQPQRIFTAFAGSQLIASGDIQTTLTATKHRIDAGETEPVLIFEDHTGAQIDFDWRGNVEDVLARLAEHPLFAAQLGTEAGRSGPGRPKLGVVSREVSLLPRHWEWLETQKGGISGALRRLVDEARKNEPPEVEEQRWRDAIGRFIWTMAGNLPGFEEASRSLFANDYPKFESQIEAWPKDIREHIQGLVRRALRRA